MQNTPYLLLNILVSLGLVTLSVCAADSKEEYYLSPNATTQLLKIEKEPQDQTLSESKQTYEIWKSSLEKNYGLKVGADYHMQGFVARGAVGENKTLGGVFRLFGEWKGSEANTRHGGSLVFKLEHRHAWSTISPVDFSNEIGYAGLVQSTYSDQKWRLTTLYWKQQFDDGNAMLYAGFIDVTEYLDVYLLISPWDGFANMVFATGSATIGGLPDGALGIMAAGWISERVYIVAGIADANADAHDPFKRIDDLFSDLKTFKSIEIGCTTAKESLFFDNIHMTLWQMDARPKAGVKEGYGANFSLTHTFEDTWLGFLRGGYSNDGGALLKRSVSMGLGHKMKDQDDVVGIGLNWGRPNDELYGNAKDQWTSELFYRYQPNKYVQITPSLQLIAQPALNPDKDFIALFGLRLEASF